MRLYATHDQNQLTWLFRFWTNQCYVARHRYLWLLQKLNLNKRAIWIRPKKKKVPISEAKRKVARMAAVQAIGCWGDDDSEQNGRIVGGRKGLCIVVLKGIFNPRTVYISNEEEDMFFSKLEVQIRNKCEENCGSLEKMTVFAKHPDGVMILKFTLPSSATMAVKHFDGITELNGKPIGQKVRASYWDGVTDYTVKDEEKEEKELEQRHSEFGDWLDGQTELPEEFLLKVEE
mmetsp:Transcript_11617/g.11684  ORF Transcript_11617/g.11684 Transcript_11617/m.11684 type:complete len:232 (-) Transcript_11617:37-732(-)